MEWREEGQPTSRNGEESGPPGSQYAGTRSNADGRGQMPAAAAAEEFSADCLPLPPSPPADRDSKEFILRSGPLAVSFDLICCREYHFLFASHPYRRHALAVHESRDLNPCEEREVVCRFRKGRHGIKTDNGLLIASLRSGAEEG